jgi:hypothetical protein
MAVDGAGGRGAFDSQLKEAARVSAGGTMGFECGTCIHVSTSTEYFG